MTEEEYVPAHRSADEEPLVGSPPPRANTLLSNSAYDKLKFIAVILLPALGTLYFGLAGIWGLPKADEVVGTIIAIDTFLGVVLQISNKQYTKSDARFDGLIDVIPRGENEHGELTTDLNVSLDAGSVASKKEILVKVNRPDAYLGA